MGAPWLTATYPAFNSAILAEGAFETWQPLFISSFFSPLLTNGLITIDGILIPPATAVCLQREGQARGRYTTGSDTSLL